MIDTVAFKTAIIDLAVTGQLSSQFHAEDSVKDIITVLPSLSNKRKKLLGQNFEYGKQAVLPNHWQWVCLGKITSYGDTPQKAYFDNVSGETWILDLEDIKSGGQITKKTRVHGKKFIGEKTVFSKGQVLYSKLRPYLKKVLVADEDGISTPELISFDVFGGMIPQYIVYCLLSSFTGKAIEKRSYGIKMPRIDADFMVNLPIPVPPISEQQFIVDRVQAAFSEIDTIDELQAKYADNLTALKSKLIEAGLRGMMSEQFETDGDPNDLVIGKPKKTKRMSNNPYEIPSSWIWTSIEEVSVAVGKKEDQIFANDVKKNGKYPAISQGEQFIDGYTDEEKPIMDVPVIVFGDHTKNVKFVDFPFVICADGTKCLRIPKAEPKYVYYWMRFAATQIEDRGYARHYSLLKKYPLPLPPLAEQKRIVAKLDEVLKMIEV